MDKQLLHNIFDHYDCLSERKLLDYVNNSLSNIERNEVERHTINCKFCSDAIDGFMGQENSIANYQSLKQNPFYRKRKTKTILWLSGIAASILAILIVNNLNSLKLDNQFTAEGDKKNLKEVTIQYTVKDSVNLDHQPQIKKQEKNISLESSKTHKEEVSSPRQKPSEVINKKSKPDFSTTNFETDNNEEIGEIKIVKEVFETRAAQNKSQTKADLNKLNEENTVVINEKRNYFKTNAKLEPKDTNSFNYETDSVPNLNIQEINEVESNSRKKLKDKYIAPLSALDSGITFYENKQFENAIKQLNTLKKADPDYFKAQLYTGKSHLKLNRPLVSVKFLTEALKGNKKTKKEAKSLLKSIK